MQLTFAGCSCFLSVKSIIEMNMKIAQNYRSVAHEHWSQLVNMSEGSKKKNKPHIIKSGLILSSIYDPKLMIEVCYKIYLTELTIMTLYFRLWYIYDWNTQLIPKYYYYHYYNYYYYFFKNFIYFILITHSPHLLPDKIHTTLGLHLHLFNPWSPISATYILSSGWTFTLPWCHSDMVMMWLIRNFSVDKRPILHIGPTFGSFFWSNLEKIYDIGRSNYDYD